MREELVKILDDSLKWSCKHLPCSEEMGCTECGVDSILTIFAEKVQEAMVENPPSLAIPLAIPDGYRLPNPHCQAFKDCITNLRDRLLKELEP
ncbi:MAG: hypothetical protein V3S51_07250 [Dehalococcoidia bacterium]